MNNSLDRLYGLLPVVHRLRDVERGRPLRALLQVIAEQVDILEQDIDQLYENWFIETCQDWVVPYLGDLVGYEPVHEAGAPGSITTRQGRLRNKILIPRREVANTVRYRRRKGTLAVLELLAQDVAGWPARAVEYYRLVSFNQSINHLRPNRGRTVDLRDGYALERINSPFDEISHTADIRRINSLRTRGRFGLFNIGCFIWRLKSYKITQSPAYCLESIGDHCFSFSALGNDMPLFLLPVPEEAPTEIAGVLNLPGRIKREAFAANKSDYFGEDKSLQLWIGKQKEARMVTLDEIVIANLSDWEYLPLKGKIAIDPELGRIAFSPMTLPEEDVWVAYHYGFSTELGGGEYDRTYSEPDEVTTYLVGAKGDYPTINEAISKWEEDKKNVGEESLSDRLRNAVVEITDSNVYTERIHIKLGDDQSLQLRAANRARPVIHLLDWKTPRPDNLKVSSEHGSHFTMDGLLVCGRGVRIDGELKEIGIRHTTLVPGWDLQTDCSPIQDVEPSLELVNTDAVVTIEHSILGAIQIDQHEVRTEPIHVQITDSILDATNTKREVFGRPGGGWAHAALTVKRSTIFGEVETHAIELAENSIFLGLAKVVRSQRGCMRFCYVSPGSRTPRRFRCQPDLVEEMVRKNYGQAEGERELKMERIRVRPRFISTRYGTPDYCRLSDICAVEIQRGADDQGEIGVFHDLFLPQREINLRARLNEYTPAGVSADLISIT